MSVTLQQETSVNDCALCRDGNKMQLWRTDRGSVNPVSVSTETQWQFQPKPKLVAARPTKNETRPKLNFLPISAWKSKLKPKFGRPLLNVSHHHLHHMEKTEAGLYIWERTLEYDSTTLRIATS